MANKKLMLSVLIISFKVLCIFTTSFMVGFWIHKYNMNEDISLVEYKKLKAEANIVYPELTICFPYPFLNEEFYKFGNGLNKVNYLEYLRGDIASNETFQKVRYDEVTFDLFDHLDSINVAARSDQTLTNYNCTNRQNCNILQFKNNYNGFDPMLYGFYKCFGIEINKHHLGDILAINISFKKSLMKIMKEVDSAFVMFNHPGQLRLKLRAGKPIWKNFEENVIPEFFEIEPYEILKRRNKVHKPCYDGSISYDDRLLKRQLELVSCRTPYQESYQDYAICDVKMKDSVFRMNEKIDDVLIPCDEISLLTYDYISYGFGNVTWNATFGYFPLFIMYPDRVKEIKNSVAIDEHTLIGNIGGYIGLFLGAC